jgi:hypothetical protein
MDRELSLSSRDESVELRDGETLVLEVSPGDFDLDLPEPPTLAEAEAANGALVHEEGHHPYPQCFTCGPDRAEGDGLRLFMGRVPERGGILTAAWTPHPDLVEGPELPRELLWAALDCPTIWASWLAEDGVVNVPEGTFSVLARQRVEHLEPLPLGEPAIVSAWPISRDGRKHLAGAAIHAPDGRQLARGESLLISVER